MEAKQPTQEQIKEFWEWCELVYVKGMSNQIANSCEAATLDTPVAGWYKPDYSKATSELVTLKEYPILDLNNIFKYAVPKLRGINLERNYGVDDNPQWTVDICANDRGWFDVANDDPALALFWAIWKAIHNGTV